MFGRFGVVFVAVALLLFAFTSLLGSSYYGERGLQYLTGTDRWRCPTGRLSCWPWWREA